MTRQLDPVRRRRYIRLAWALLAGPVLFTIVFGATTAPTGRVLPAALAAALAAAAPLALGALAGFLFGLPRTLSIDAAPTPGGDGRSRGAVRLAINTNLEQISDWLTKILVGVGLTQLGSLPEQLQSVAEFVATALGDHDGNVAITAAILVYFFVAGFLAGYLFTRLVLAPIFQEVANGPAEAAVERINDASLRPGAVRTPQVDDRDAAELLRFDLHELKGSREQLAWGRAKLRVGDPGAAMQAIEQVVAHDPADRRAAESLAFAALYLLPPTGFTRAIDTVRRYLDRRGAAPAAEDASLLTYLACAHGQAYAWAKSHAGEQDLAAIERDAVAAAQAAIAAAPTSKVALRAQAFPEPGNDERDLAELAADSAELRQLLS